MRVEDQSGRRVHVRGRAGCVQNSAGTWDRLRLVQHGTLLAWDPKEARWVDCELARVFREDSRPVMTPESLEAGAPDANGYRMERAEVHMRIFALCEETSSWIESELKPIAEEP